MALIRSLTGILGQLTDTAESTQIPVQLLVPLGQAWLLIAAFKILADALPETLTIFSVTANTEMMKDKTVINEVISGQKQEKNERNYRVFQAMRLMRRDYMSTLDQSCSFEVVEKAALNLSNSYLDESMMNQSIVSDLRVPSHTKRLREVTAQHILESFKKIGRPSRSSISNDN